MINSEVKTSTTGLLETIISNTKKALNEKKEDEFFELLWKIRSDIEYYTAILNLELENQLETEKLMKTIRIKKSERDKNKIISRIMENIEEIKKKKNTKTEILEYLWEIKELLTILIKELEPKKEKEEKTN